MAYEITVYTTVYEPWEEGQDEPTQRGVDSVTHAFDHLAEVAEWLRGEGVQSPSESAPYRPHTWLSLADGSRPHGWDGNYTGAFEELSAHMSSGFTEREWLALLNSVASV
jgi:hypothetical protein